MTNTPTSRSRPGDRLTDSYPPQRGDEIVEDQDAHRRHDHRGRRRRTDARRDGVARVTTTVRKPPYQHAEHARLQHAAGDIVTQVDGRLEAREIGAAVDAEQLHAHQPAAEDAAHDEERRQQRHDQHHADGAWRDDVVDGVDRHHAQPVELLGGDHGADLGCRGRAGAPGHQERGQHRAELAHQAQADDRAKRLRGTEALQGVVALEAEHHADGQPADADDGQREEAQLVDLVDHVAQAPRRRDGIARHLEQEEPHGAEIADHARRRAAEQADRRHHQLASGNAIEGSRSRLRNARTRGSALARSSSGAPSKQPPGRVRSRCSAMRMVESLSGDTTGAVRPRGGLIWVRSTSMRLTDMGSSPENGSSQSRTAGLRMMARANATRFTMPPESSPGSRPSTSCRPTASSRSWTSSAMARSSRSVCSRSGKATFSKTVMESRSAPPWNIMPSLRRTWKSARSESWVTSSSSTKTRPRCGRMSPAINRSRVLLPHPLPPRTTDTAPAGKAQERSVNTCRSPNAIDTCESSTRAPGCMRRAP